MKHSNFSRRQFLTAIALAAAAVALPACSDKKSGSKIARGSKVIALGDSLTFGYGTQKPNDYPSVLANKTGWNVINEGINGDTSEGVLNRIDGIIEQKPALILFGIGGNDVLRRVNSATTKANIISTIQKIKSANIPVVLIAEPHFSASALFGKASDNPIYKDIAESENVPLLSDAWSDILSDESLKSDQIHANEAGYAKFADVLYEFLQKQGFA